MSFIVRGSLPLLLCAWIASPLVAVADEAEAKPARETKSVPVALADGKLNLTSPDSWVPVEPKFRGIVDFEFAAPAVEGDDADGRVTIGPLSGGNEANKARWMAQFRPDDGQEAKRSKSETKKLAGAEIEIMDVVGTYVNPPFAGGGVFPKYRMLAAVIDGGKSGSYYIKFYGPAKTIAAHEKAFRSMVDSLTAK